MKRAWALVVAVLRNAWRGLQTSAAQAGMAAGTLAVALGLIGAFALLLTNMEGMLERNGQQLELVAYLEDGLEGEAAQLLRAEVAGLAGVASVDYVSRDLALERFEASPGGTELLAGLEENPLPASLEIGLANEGAEGIAPESIRALADAVLALDGVAELSQGQAWVEGYARALSLLRVAVVVLATVLALATLLVVTNTIRLAVYARRDELDILDLVGASRSFVRAPFVIEGFVQGLVAGLVALVVLWLGYQLALPRLESGLALFLGNASPRFFDAGEALRLVGSGALLGVIGSCSALWGLRETTS